MNLTKTRVWYFYTIFFLLASPWLGGQSITLIQPNGGENINPGSPYNIQWTSTGISTNVSIAYSIDNGTNWYVVVNDTDDDGTYAWTPPFMLSSSCLVRITGEAVITTSSSTFSIVDDGINRIIVTSANGGERWVANETYDITWITTGTVGDVKIQYTTDKGITSSDVVASTGNTGSYSWMVPNTPSTKCLLQISETDDDDPLDRSDGVFTILAPGTSLAEVTYPDGNEVLTGGNNYAITWTTLGTIYNVEIEYSIDNGSNWQNIISATPNDGSYTWIVPNRASSQCLVRVKDALDGSPMGQSDSVFTIATIGAPSLDITSPNGGETLLIGVGHNVTWDSTGYLDRVHIEYSTNNGTSWTTIVASTTNDGSHFWGISDSPSSQCLVRISDAADGTPADTSDSTFSLQQPSESISITSPAGGESWQVGDVESITWTSYGGVGNVKIEFSSDNKSSWTTLTNSTTNDGVYAWTIPNTPSSNCFIKISESVDGNPSNTNFNPFSIISIPEEPEIGLNHTQLYFASLKASSANTTPQRIIVDNIGDGVLTWQASYDESWIKLDNNLGTQSGLINVSTDSTGLAAGSYNGTISITSNNAINSPQTIDVSLTVYPVGGNMPAWGTFETPTDGATVQSSIPVTGWVLDDIGVESVKIYRKEGGALVYIGDAVFVEGARPDVAQLYPTYPMSYQAGWGYMMLTNFLPNGGNGTFNIHAMAEDAEGHLVSLGSKTITCDNANAVKPFGAIDTPAQGGDASGDNYINWGWALTPMPNNIPTNGSTIDVFIDGVDVGHPTYNVYREDIATKFPGYANSNGAIGYFSIDTTDYSNGLHTIQWVAKDSAGNTDGIGSRYFTIQNSGYVQDNSTIPLAADSTLSLSPFQLKGLSKKFEVKQGGIINIDMNVSSLKPIRVLLKNGDRLLQPVGSTLKDGVFYWDPGYVFQGEYDLIITFKEKSGKDVYKTLRVHIQPR
jgi:hypothetical protein